jgi:hypothetical protein
VFAVQAEPAEAAPREQVTLTALYARGDGEVDTSSLDWAFCLQRKSLAELGPVAPACLVQESADLTPLGAGEVVSGSVPEDACRLFGPDRPRPMGDEPVGRAVDPDPTGGFYQPLRLYDPTTSHYATFEERVSCSLPGVTQGEFASWNRRYRRNQNPAVDALSVPASDATIAPAADDQAAYSVKAGETLTLRASWPECGDGSACEDGICGFDETVMSCAADCKPSRGCGGAEHYLYYDLDQHSFVERREGMRVAWFATAGSFRDARTGREESDAGSSFSDNEWTAPSQSGEVRLWIVLRDDRGGVAWQSYRLVVE